MVTTCKSPSKEKNEYVSFSLYDKKRTHASLSVCVEKKESISLSLYEQKTYVCLSPSVIYSSTTLLKRRTVTNNNAENQPNGLFNCPLDVGGYKLHGTVG